MRKFITVLTIATFASHAHAELPAAVTTSISTAGTDTVAAVTAMIGVAVGIWAIRKVLALFGR